MNDSPPPMWQEHWFEHDQLLHLAGATGHVALYFDPDMDDDAERWLLPYLDEVWQYTKQTFGEFGPDPLLYSIFHQGKYAGGHPSSYQDPSHDYRNVTDCGPGPYREGDNGIHEMVTHEISHVVEGANNGAWGSPAFPIWGDSKWAEFFIYDAYTALGQKQWALDVAQRFARNSDDFPRRGTHWFRDWWRPLRTDAGEGPQVMVRFFRLLAEHFPRGADTRYVRDLTWANTSTSPAARPEATCPTWPGARSGGIEAGAGSWRGLDPSSQRSSTDLGWPAVAPRKRSQVVDFEPAYRSAYGAPELRTQGSAEIPGQA